MEPPEERTDTLRDMDIEEDMVELLAAQEASEEPETPPPPFKGTVRHT